MSPATQLPLDIRLRDDARISTWLGTAASRLLAAEGIVYVWGAPGTGCSHLLQALCHVAKEVGDQAIYVGSPATHAPALLEGLELMPLICIDDIQTIAGDGRWEESLFHLLNSVRDRGGRLVLAANCPARLIGIALADLKSRLLAAQSIETDALDDLQKLRLLQQKATRQGFFLTDQVGRYILERASRDMRGLLLQFESLEVETVRQHRKLTIPFVRKTLQL